MSDSRPERIHIESRDHRNASGPADLTDYMEELRAAEIEFRNRPYPGGQHILGASIWYFCEPRERLRAINERHGIKDDDPRVYSIAAYKAELATIHEKSRRPDFAASMNVVEFWNWQADTMADCAARHFPGFGGFLGRVARHVDTYEKLWFHSTFLMEVRERQLRPRFGPEFPETGPHANKDVREIYSILRRLGLSKWIPRPPFPTLNDDEAMAEMAQIAERLEDMERSRLDHTIHARPLPAPDGAVSRPSLEAPSEKAMQCYRLKFLRGDTRTQASLAREVYGDRGKQYQVSRDIKAITAWIKAGNVLPDLDTSRPKITSVDPSQLDKGPRMDRGRKPRA